MAFKIFIINNSNSPPLCLLHKFRSAACVFDLKILKVPTWHIGHTATVSNNAEINSINVNYISKYISVSFCKFIIYGIHSMDAATISGSLYRR